MMKRFTNEPYRNATTLSKHLFSLIIASKEGTKEVAMLVREWREMENMKRAWRGIAPLAPASLREMLAAKREAAKQIDVSSTASPAFTEVD